MKKIKNSYVKLILWMLVGGIIGFIGGFIGGMIELERVESAFNNAFDFTIENIILFQIAMFIMVVIVILVNYMSVKKLVNSENENDSDVGEISDTIERKQTYALACSSSNYILSFIVFGIAIDERNPLIIGSVIVFLISIIFSTFMEVALVKQVKKSNPMKKGDPSDLNFENKWIESCDEAEKLIIYQAAYKTFVIMKHLFLGTLLLVFISKTAFGTGNLPIVMVGLLWLVMILSYSYYGSKLQKKKINV